MTDSFVYFQIGINSTTGEVRIIPVGASAMQNGNGSKHSCRELVSQFLKWGKEFGGEGGWSEAHQKNVKTHMERWQQDPAFPESPDRITAQWFEAHLMTMKNATNGNGKPLYAPGTQGHRYTAFRAFVTWLVDNRKILREDPLSGCRKPATRPVKKCRILSMQEFCRLHAASPAYRAMNYLVAVQTAFRQGELDGLRAGCVDAVNNRIWLGADLDKTTQDWWFPLTPELSKTLAEQAKGKHPEDLLLRMNSTPIQEFDKDCHAAGILKKTEDGVIDFHGLRRTAITWFEETGASEGMVRQFGRHSSRSSTHRYRKPKLDDMRSHMCKVEEALHTARKMMVEDTGIEPVTFRLPVQPLQSAISPDFTALLELTLAYIKGNPLQRSAGRAWSDSILRGKP